MASNTKRKPGRPKGSTNKRSNTPRSNQEKIQELQIKRARDRKVVDEIWAITIIALGLFLAYTVFFDTTGTIGNTVHDVCFGLFSTMSYILPFFLIVGAVLLFSQKLQHISIRTSSFFILMFLMFCMLNSYRFIDESNLSFSSVDFVYYYEEGISVKFGGAIGMVLGSLIVKGFGKPGLIIFACAGIVICFLLVANTPLSKWFTRIYEKHEARKILREIENEEIQKQEEERREYEKQKAQVQGIELPRKDTVIPVVPVTPVTPEPPVRIPHITFTDNRNWFEKLFSPSGKGPLDDGISNSNPTYGLDEKTEIPDNSNSESIGFDAEEPSIKYGIEESVAPDAGFGLGDYGESIESSQIVESEILASEIIDDEETDTIAHAQNTKQSISKYKLPTLTLLKTQTGMSHKMTKSEIQQKIELLEQTLKNFKVDANVLDVTQGPSVTRYEVQPSTGVKVSSLTKLTDDIALNMQAKSIRMEAPIPGKAAVGIEIENEEPTPVFIKDLISSNEFKQSKSKISFVVGKDISGKNIIANLADMPHLLIAGSTGSGKSVCINSIITSILYKAKPDEVKFILIDPKVVELGSYNGIPHLLTEVVSDPSRASKALTLAVSEMNKRYDEFAEIGVKDLKSFNEYQIANHEPAKQKPQIVIIIDELADLMMASPKQVEDSICRLAQKARACGMHLIVATQRPSVDIVTGLIKANIPSRIAFSVSSQVDSRTILDIAGAEKLLGKGDMLYSPSDSNKPIRIQGPYISDSETHAIIDYIKSQGVAEYDPELSKAIEQSQEPLSGKQLSMSDELYDEAASFIVSSGSASVSMLQRRFRIGYNRAARLIDEMEENGIIGPADGARPRKVLISHEELDNSSRGLD